MVYLVRAKEITPPEVVGLRSALQAYQVRTTRPDLFGVWEDPEARVKWRDIKDHAKARMDAYLANNPGAEAVADDFMPDWYEFEFSFVDVSADRRAWAETLLATYCAIEEWKIAALRHENVREYAHRRRIMPSALGYPMRSRLARFIRPSRKKRNGRRRHWLRRLFD